jgi:quinol monooxygenase YgiN
MAVNLVAIITVAGDHENTAEALFADLAAKVASEEPDVLRYEAYKRVGETEGGAIQYVMVER